MFKFQRSWICVYLQQWTQSWELKLSSIDSTAHKHTEYIKHSKRSQTQYEEEDQVCWSQIKMKTSIKCVYKSL